MSDRTVHGTGNDGHAYEIVRYEKAGKWFIEYIEAARYGLPCRHVSILGAVWAATEPRYGLSGGSRFDKLRREMKDLA